MSFLTEYFDEYREHPIRKTKLCRPEARFAKLEGKWMVPKSAKKEVAATEEEAKAFIKTHMMSLRGQSTYFNDFCAHLDQDFKTRQFVPRPKKKPPCKSTTKDQEMEVVSEVSLQKLAMKDTELMKVAKEIYERDMDKPTLRPLDTHFRILGYSRPRLYKTGLSDYQAGIARVAYELIRDDRIPPYVAHNGGRPRWGYPPEGTRQPLLDGVPFDGERLYD